MSRTAALSFLAVASFALAGADYYVQAVAAKQPVRDYGLTRYKESIVTRIAPTPEEEAAKLAAAAAKAAENGQPPAKLKTKTQQEAERVQEIDELIPEVWEHLTINRKETEARLPQVRSSGGSSSGQSFKRIRLVPKEP